MADQNRIFRTHIGAGYYGTFVPQVIQRNILENPGWYTAIRSIPGRDRPRGRQGAAQLPDDGGGPHRTAHRECSLLDEATAAAEAMALTHAVARGTMPLYLVDADCHPQTVAVVVTRAKHAASPWKVQSPTVRVRARVIGCLVQYPATDGGLRDFARDLRRCTWRQGAGDAATDLLRLRCWCRRGDGGGHCRRQQPAVGVPIGYGGPHAALLRNEGMSTSVTCRGGSSAYRRTATATPPFAWHCRRGSSTSAARRRPATSARRRSCWPSWRACTRCTTGLTGSGVSPNGRTTGQRSWRMRCAGWATGSCTITSSTHSAPRWSGGAPPHRRCGTVTPDQPACHLPDAARRGARRDHEPGRRGRPDHHLLAQ